MTTLAGDLVPDGLWAIVAPCFLLRRARRTVAGTA
jgi:hypothetical protein